MSNPLAALPEEIRTSRMLLRWWRPEDAPALQVALRAAWPELQQWIPWVFEDPEDLAGLTARLRQHASDFAQA